MVKYKPKKSPDEMREKYESRSESMTMNYSREMGPEKIKKRGEKFASGYKEVRWKIVEFVRAKLKHKAVTGQRAVELQNVISEAYSAYQNLYRGSAKKYLDGVASTIASLRGAGILTDDDVRDFRRFIIDELKIPAEDVDAYFRTYGLPTA